MARMMESEEAARRLGVKLTTLYAYVSRGMLTSHPSQDSRRSLFDLEEVERLARRSRSGRRVESRLASITTAVTQIRDDGPAYRGLPVSTLARTHSFEAVAELLWGFSPADGGRADAGPCEWQALDLPGQPKNLKPPDTIRWAVLMCGARDPLRSDLRTETVVRNARTVIATSVACLRDGPIAQGSIAHGSIAHGSIAEQLAQCFVASPDPALVRAINTALVLLADHELATSTLAARVAASTRADIYDAITAALCVMAGPLHGAVSELAHAVLVQAENSGVAPALDATLRWQGSLPGFGHAVYTAGDPRYQVLAATLDEIATPARLQVLECLIDLARSHAIPGPNTDLALAALTWAGGLPASAGQTIFSIARMAGWTAHYLEELNERPLRFRARAVYAST